MATGQRVQKVSEGALVSPTPSDSAVSVSRSPLVVSLSIIIPVFNSEQSLPVLLARLNSILGELALHYEVVLVNDGSPDRSGQVLDEAVETYPWMRVIHLMRN